MMPQNRSTNFDDDPWPHYASVLSLRIPCHGHDTPVFISFFSLQIHTAQFDVDSLLPQRLGGEPQSFVPIW